MKTIRTIHAAACFLIAALTAGGAHGGRRPQGRGDGGDESGRDWATHAAGLFDRIDQLDGARLPGARRHLRRQDHGPRAVNAALVEKIRELCG